jgi:hypothetical protein
LQLGFFQQPRIGGHCIARSQQHGVAGNQIACFDDKFTAICISKPKTPNSKPQAPNFKPQATHCSSPSPSGERENRYRPLSSAEHATNTEPKPVSAPDSDARAGVEKQELWRHLQLLLIWVRGL